MPILKIIAPLPSISKRTRLQKITECGSHFSRIDFFGWQRLNDEALDSNSQIILKGGGYSSKKARLMYLFWILKVFFLALGFKKDNIVWALGFESAFPCVLASKIKGFKVVYDDADRFSSLFNFPDFIKKILIKLEVYTSFNSFRHIIPGVERYEFKSPKFFILKNTPTNEDIVKAEKFELDQKVKDSLNPFPLIIYINGWLGEGRGLRIIHKVAKELPEIGFLLAGRVDSKYAEQMLKFNNVIYLGELAQYKALAYYKLCHFVFTYYDPKVPINRLAEANKWGDALQYSTPVIVNSEVITAQYLRDANAAISTNYENIHDLIEQLKVVGNSSEKYQELVNSIKLLQKKFPTFDLQLKKLFLEME